ncbi:alpha/beta hydrolase domain-containing protein 17A, partial [Huso huso]
MNGLSVSELCCLFCCPPLPWPDRSQAGLPASGAHLRPPARAGVRALPHGGEHVAARPHPRRFLPLEAAPDREGRVPVLAAGARQHRGVPGALQPRESHRLHVHPLCALRQVHGPLLPWERGGSGADEQLLHWPGHPYQLQHLLLRLLGLRGEHGQAVREEPVRRHRRRLAGSADQVRDQPGEHHPVRAEHWHRAHGGPGIALRVRRGGAALPPHLRHEGGIPRHQEDLLLRRLPQHREGFQDHLPRPHHPRHGGRGHRLLSRDGAVRALPQGRGAAVGGGRRAQRHRTVQPVPGAAAQVHHTRPGEPADL